MNTYDKLLSDQTFNIEFNGYLTNHVKHAIIALQKIDAPPSMLQKYWDLYTDTTPYGLSIENVPEAWDKVIPSTEEEWKETRGMKVKWQNYCIFLKNQLEERFDNNVSALVAHYAPDVIPGMVGALTHGIIHAGWALDAFSSSPGGEKKETSVVGPWMVIEGLAYLNFSFVSVHPEGFKHGAIKEDSVMDSLLRIGTQFHEEHLAESWIARAKATYDKESGFHTELIPAGFQWEVSKVLAHQHPVAYNLPTWLDTKPIDVVLKDLYKAATVIYLTTLDEKDGHGNFVVLHLLSSLWGLEHVLTTIENDDVSRSSLKAFYVAMICLLSSSAAGFPHHAALQSTIQTHFESNDDDDMYDKEIDKVEKNEWMKTVERAYDEIEEHNIKLVYVTRELWRRYNHLKAFRLAGEAFTLTPNIGPKDPEFDA